MRNAKCATKRQILTILARTVCVQTLDILSKRSYGGGITCAREINFRRLPNGKKEGDGGKGRNGAGF